MAWSLVQMSVPRGSVGTNMRRKDCGNTLMYQGVARAAPNLPTSPLHLPSQP